MRYDLPLSDSDPPGRYAGQVLAANHGEEAMSGESLLAILIIGLIAGWLA